MTESQQQSELGRDDNSGATAPGKAAAAGLGHESGSEEHAVDRGAATGAEANPDDEDRTRTRRRHRGGGFATDDVREDAKYADGGGDVSANPVGGIGRDTGSASEGGPGTEGGLGSD